MKRKAWTAGATWVAAWRLKWTAVVVVAIAIIATWLFWTRERTEWSDEVPHRFRGSWRLVEDYYSENRGIRSIHFQARQIVLEMARGESEMDALSKFPVRRVSITSRKRSEAGEMVVFYGQADDKGIAKNRLQIYFGRKQKITVQEIVPTGWGEDHWFDVGEFVKVN